MSSPSHRSNAMRRTAHLTCAFALLAALAGCSTGVSGTPAVGSTGFGPTSAASTQSTASGTSRSSTSSPATSSGTGRADTSSADITLASGVTLEELKKDMQVAQDDELQADCLGAAALFGAAADGTLTIEDGDEKEMVNSLSALADEMAWTSSADHGDPFQRVQWFTLGRNGGVNACHDVLETSGATDAPTSEALPTG